MSFTITHTAVSGVTAFSTVETSAPAAVSRALYVAETFGGSAAGQVTISTGVGSDTVVATVSCGGVVGKVTWKN